MRVINSLLQYDLRMLLWCRKSRLYPALIVFVRMVSRSGDGYMQAALPLLLWLVAPTVGKPFFLLVFYSFIIERSLYFVLKNTLRRQRPPLVVPDFQSIVEASDKFSFPSGHTMAAFLLAGLALSTFGLAALPLYLWAMAVGSSRVILGVHFPSDILAGALIGSAIAIAMASL